ncbi:hypothetical protein RND81_14G240200 [Saponaria officinalis]|uniref:Uncharacterized protein n=1 Tax=Saponaria officinalis TaxID=3572 RepID=A0AAW1GT76_SAPOF
MWSNHIRRIVRITQMLKRWRKSTSPTAAGRRRSNKIGCAPPSDVPPGHVAVVVSETARRFVVRTKHLHHPLFRNLLKKAEEVFGFDIDGPICLPCDESVFEDVLRVVTRSGQVGGRCRAAESLPLLRPETPLF